MAEQDIRYCTTEDGVRIAYCVEGEGPALLVCPMFLESFSLEDLVPEYAGFYRLLGRGRLMVRYDMRGTGLSQRSAEDMSLEALVADMRAVVRATGVESVALWAPTSSGPRAIRYTVDNPGLVSALLLYGTFATPPMPSDVAESLAALCRGNWPMAARAFADSGSARIEASDVMAGFARYFEQSTTGDVASTFLLQHRPDVQELLPRLGARTLVIHRIADSGVPFAAGQELAARIPAARLITPPGSIHGFIVDGAAIAADVAAFLDEHPVTRACGSANVDDDVATTVATHSPFRTILFTDLVGHTEMMSRLGDEAGRAVLREHERITREVLREHGGVEVKTLGDGFMASFGSVTRAVECAIALQRAIEARNQGAEEGGLHPSPGTLHPLSVRVGLNAGEPIAEEGDLFGATVILASRIAAQAEGGEVLIPEPVRHLLAGKGFVFADRGEFLPKGFEDAVRLYEVRWQE